MPDPTPLPWSAAGAALAAAPGQGSVVQRLASLAVMLLTVPYSVLFGS